MNLSSMVESLVQNFEFHNLKTKKSFTGDKIVTNKQPFGEMEYLLENMHFYKLFFLKSKWTFIFVHFSFLKKSFKK